MGQQISWEHVCELYRRNLGSVDNCGVSMVHKLTMEHINLTSFLKMRVDLAAQVKWHYSCCTFTVNGGILGHE